MKVFERSKECEYEGRHVDRLQLAQGYLQGYVGGEGMARVVTSVIARGQNCAPVHDTTWPMMLLGLTDRREPALVKIGSFMKASTRSSGMLGRRKFCSTVRRISL